MLIKEDLLLRFFPPPKFLEMPAAGLDLSDRSVKFAELVRRADGLALGRWGEREIPAGVIQAGQIKKPDELKKVLTALASQTGLNYLNVSLPEEKAYLVTMKMPPTPRRHLSESIELELEEHVPIPASQVVFDYEIIEETAEGPRLIVSVFPRDLAEEYAQAVLAAGFLPLSFEIEAQALARSVIPSGDRGTFMIVDFGSTRISFVIVSAGLVLFSSTVAIGGQDINEAVREKLGVSPEMAREIKEKRGLSRSSENRELFAAVGQLVSVLRDELAKHYLYWNTHPGDDGIRRDKIEKVFLCGGDANIPGLTEYLSAGAEVPISLANPWVNIIASFDEAIPALPFNHSLRYDTALGLALRRFRK